MRFSSVPGCQPQKNYLQKIITSQKIPHAQLFIDRSGGAALPLAYAFITALHCPHSSKGTPCGQCHSCHKMEHFAHPDLYPIFPIPALPQKGAPKKLNPATAWAQFLQAHPHGDLPAWAEFLASESKTLHIRKEQVTHMKTLLHKKSFAQRHKVFLIWRPEHAHPVAANALLKIIEEPAPHTYFIFVTADPQAILPTLYSRMWHLHIPKLPEKELLHHLKNNHPDNAPTRHQEAAKIAQGNLHLAEKLVRGELQSHFHTFAPWLRAAYRHSWKDLAETAEAFHSYTPTAQKSWLTYALAIFHFILSHYCHTQAPLSLTAQEAQFTQRLTQTLDLQQIQLMSQHLMHLQEELPRNVYARLAFISCSLHIATLFRSV